MTSFEFKWNDQASTKVKGKIFAKKRKNNNGESKTGALSALSEKSKNIGKPKNISKSALKLTQSHEPQSTKKDVFLKVAHTADSIEKASQKNISRPPTISKSAYKSTQSHEPKSTKKDVFLKAAQTADNIEKTSEITTKFTPGGLIKRKRKKDKQASNLQHSTTEDNTVQNTISQNIQNKSHSLFSEKHKNLYINTDMRGKSLVENVFSEGKKFCDLDIHKYIIANLEKINFVALTTVQEKSIPVVLSGSNVLIRSQTGSGKTLAYAVPILDSLVKMEPRLNRHDGVQAVIIVPTRELALQTHELFGKINTFQWIVVGHLCGGENRKTEKDRLRKGVHILIATPGRLLDHILHTSAFKVQNVRCLVLDEADRLLDMGFKRDLVSIVEELDKAKRNAEYNPLALLKQYHNQKTGSKDIQSEETDTKNHSPLSDPSSKDRQTLLLSATLSKDIVELTDFIMKDHIYIDALDDYAHSEKKHMIIPNTVKQEFIMSYVKHRLFTLSALLVAKSKQNSKVFVFMATSQMVDYHYELFTRCLLQMPKNRGKLKIGDVVLLDEAEDDSEDEEEIVLDTQFFKLHGSMDQNARKEIFTGFRAAKKGVLLCTDVAARGVDVPTADCIIQYNGPQSDDDYLHRVGRTGRAGKQGHAIIFLTHEEQEFVSRLQEYKVFLKKRDPEEYLKFLCDLMEEPEYEKAAVELQRRYENAVVQDKDLHRMACFAYASWSRFYNTYPAKMRSVFNFKNVNLGHYVTSFALRETPTTIARVVKGQVVKQEPRRFNKKLATHGEEELQKPPPKKKIRSISLATSEYSSGLDFMEKKKKQKR